MSSHMEDLVLRHGRLRRLAATLLLRAVNLAPVRLACAARLKRLVARAAPGQAWLHLGCGKRPLRRWINIDILPYAPGPDVLWDLRRPFPLPDGSIDLIYSEDLIEHLEFSEGRQLLGECYRLLRPGGTMRLLTPNLRPVAEAYVQRSPELLAWYGERYGTASYAELLNHALRSWGHVFIYDEDLLTRELRAIGFSLERQAVNQSSHLVLRGLDRAEEQESVYRLYFDCLKPGEEKHPDA
jgi:predicted SAM-dependent methyltransferase